MEVFSLSGDSISISSETLKSLASDSSKREPDSSVEEVNYVPVSAVETWILEELRKNGSLSSSSSDSNSEATVNQDLFSNVITLVRGQERIRGYIKLVNNEVVFDSVETEDHISDDNQQNFVLSYIISCLPKVRCNGYAFCFVTLDGCLKAHGDKRLGGDCSEVEKELQGDIQSIYNNKNAAAFCAIRKSDGHLFSWGHKHSGGDCSVVKQELDGDIAQIYCTKDSFCAIRKSDGHIFTWGGSEFGGDCSGVKQELDGDIAQIYYNDYSFCAIRKSDGHVFTWGDSEWGGDCSGVKQELDGDIAHIYPNNLSFCAVRKSDGHIFTWGGSE